MKRVFYLFLIALVGCNQAPIENALEWNQKFKFENTPDSIPCLLVNNPGIEPEYVLTLNQIQHELVDQTPGIARIRGRFLDFNTNDFILSFAHNDDTLKAICPFNLNNPKAFQGKEILIEGGFTTHPNLTIKANGILVMGMSKK